MSQLKMEPKIMELIEGERIFFYFPSYYPHLLHFNLYRRKHVVKPTIIFR